MSIGYPRYYRNVHTGSVWRVRAVTPRWALLESTTMAFRWTTPRKAFDLTYTFVLGPVK